MAVPKIKTSKSRTKKRFSKWQELQRKNILGKVNLVPCSNCFVMKLNHRVCAECGYYNGEQIISNNSKKAKNTVQV